MSEGSDQANMGQGQSQMLSQAQAQGNNQRDTEIGMNGTTDLGNNTTVSGDTGIGGGLAGSAAGATEGSDMQQEQPGYGSNPGEAGQQQGTQNHDDVQADSLDDDSMDDEDDDDDDDDMGDGASAASAAGGGAM